MPEKPEVVTVANTLKKYLIDRIITEVEVIWDNIIEYPTVVEFKEKIKNQKINDITTRGKWLLISLTDYNLLIHLRMEGKFTFRDKDSEVNKHEHVLFLLDNDKQWRYHDVRKFGKMLLLTKEETYKRKPLNELGYEYTDENLTPEYLVEAFKKKVLPIKTVLLDQSIIAGIGNIYDNEILFMSKINPYTKAKDLTKKDCQEIIKNTKIVLDKAIALGGTTIKSYTSDEGVHGLFQNELLVHGQKVCKNCQENLVKVAIGGRGTYYCPKCQKQ